MTDFHEAIANYFEEQATWREQKAADYPEDERNQMCADGLRELAAHVRGLLTNDERIIELGTLGVRDGLFSPPPGDSASFAISHFRFGHDDDCDRFLTSLVPMFRDDAIRQAQDAGELGP